MSAPAKPTGYVPPKMITHRPGAEQAAKLPSLENGKPVPARRPVAQCVGSLSGYAWRDH